MRKITPWLPCSYFTGSGEVLVFSLEEPLPQKYQPHLLVDRMVVKKDFHPVYFWVLGMQNSQVQDGGKLHFHL